MRTSLSQQIQTQLMYISSASQGLQESQTHAVSGKRITKPSDDTSGTIRALSLRSTINTLDQFTNNMVVTKPLLQTSEASIASIVRVVRGVRDIAIGAGNPTNTDTAMIAYADQLDDALSQLADLANTKHMDQFVFSGTASDQPTVVANSGDPPYTYNGNSGTKSVQVLSWVSLQSNVPGDKLFNFDGSAGADTTDLFTMVKNLRDDVLAGDVSKISDNLTNIDKNLDNLLSNQARVGSWISRLDSATSMVTENTDRVKEMLSDVEDVDLAQAVIDMKTCENVYQSALAVSQRVMDLSLASEKYW